MKLVAIGISLGLTSILTSKPAVSLAPIPVHVEVGLDDGTKALLETLPIKLREQFVLTVNQSLDTLDFHFEKYVRDLQSAASETTEETACVTGGELSNIGNDLAKGLLTL